MPWAACSRPGLQQRLGVNVIVENRPGASGAIATGQVARAKPDGSQWVLVFDSHAVNPALQKLAFDTETDLEPVLLVGTAPYLLATHPSKPFKSLADVMAAAKERPGKVTYASVGTGTLGHLAMVLIGKRAGVDITHVALPRRRPGGERRGRRPRRSRHRLGGAADAAGARRDAAAGGADRQDARSQRCRAWRLQPRAEIQASRPSPGGACSRPKAHQHP